MNNDEMLENKLRAAIKEGFDVNITDRSGITMLMTVAEKGKHRLMEILIQAGASIDARNNINGRSALHYAAVNNHKKAMELLIKSGSDLNVTNFQQRTPLMEAAHVGSDPKTLQCLIRAGTNIDIKDKDGHVAHDLYKGEPEKFSEIVLGANCRMIKGVSHP